MIKERAVLFAIVSLLMAALGLDCHKPNGLDMVVNAVPGLWQMTVRKGMKGMSTTWQTKTLTHCVTDKDLQKGMDQWILTLGDCENKDYTVAGNTVNWQLKCTGEYAGSGTGEADFEGDTYESSASVQIVYDGHPTFQIDVRGKRIGDCP